MLSILHRLPLFGPLYLLPLLLALLGVKLVFAHPWYEDAPLGQPLYGVDFSCRQAEWLGENCHQALIAILSQLQVRHLRLSAYWDEIEPEPGVYDFAELDWELAEAARYGARVTLSVGMKGQRAPQYYLPAWALAGQKIPDGSSPADDPKVAAETLAFVRATVAHEASQPVIEVWQVENEPYVHFFDRAHNWSLPTWFLEQEAQAIRAGDPQRRPLLITHATWMSVLPTWQRALGIADILGESVYTKQNLGGLRGFYFYPYQIGPLTPDLPLEAQTAAREGKAFWIDELQAEPYETAAVGMTSPAGCNFPSISPARFQANLRLADRSGASRVYLWGAEWWYYCLTVHDDASYWQIARQTLLQSEAREARRPQPILPSARR